MLVFKKNMLGKETMQVTSTKHIQATSALDKKTNKLFTLADNNPEVATQSPNGQDRFEKSNALPSNIGFQNTIPTSQDFVKDYDTNKNSKIDKKEFLSAVKGLALGGRLKSQKLLEKIFTELDVNRDGELSETELGDLQALSNKIQVRSLSDLAETLISEKDKDGDGKLAPEEFNVCLESYYTKIEDPSKLQKPDFIKQLSEAIFKQFDADGDGKLNTEELLEIFNYMITKMDEEGKGAFKDLESQTEEQQQTSGKPNA